MRLTFGYCYSPKNYLYKDVDTTRYYHVDGHLHLDSENPCDVENPIFDITDVAIGTANSLAGCNYVVINDWARAYFIEKFQPVGNNRYRVVLSEDYLGSWRVPIDNLNALVVKQEFPKGKTCYQGSFLTYPQDVPIESDDETYIESLGPLGVAWNYYVTVNGGVYN